MPRALWALGVLADLVPGSSADTPAPSSCPSKTEVVLVLEGSTGGAAGLADGLSMSRMAHTLVTELPSCTPPCCTTHTERGR